MVPDVNSPYNYQETEGPATYTKVMQKFNKRLNLPISPSKKIR